MVDCQVNTVSIQLCRYAGGERATGAPPTPQAALPSSIRLWPSAWPRTGTRRHGATAAPGRRRLATLLGGVVAGRETKFSSRIFSDGTTGLHGCRGLIFADGILVSLESLRGYRVETSSRLPQEGLVMLLPKIGMFPHCYTIIIILKACPT